MTLLRDTLVTSIPACLGLSVFLLITYDAIRSSITLFSWHPIFMTLAFVYCPACAFYAIRQKNNSNNYQLRLQSSTYHGYIQVISILFLLLGFLAIIINKIRYNKSHFTSYHSWWGFLAILLFLFNAYIGISKTFKTSNTPQWLWKNLLHRIFGNIGFSVSGISFYYALYMASAFGYKNIFISFSIILVIHALSFFDGISSLLRKQSLNKS